MLLGCVISVNHLGGDLPVGDNLRSLSLITPSLEHVTTLILGYVMCAWCVQVVRGPLDISVCMLGQGAPARFLEVPPSTPLLLPIPSCLGPASLSSNGSAYVWCGVPVRHPWSGAPPLRMGQPQKLGPSLFVAATAFGRLRHVGSGLWDDAFFLWRL